MEKHKDRTSMSSLKTSFEVFVDAYCMYMLLFNIFLLFGGKIYFLWHFISYSLVSLQFYYHCSKVHSPNSVCCINSDPFYEISWPLHISFPIYEPGSDSLHLLIKSTNFSFKGYVSPAWMCSKASWTSKPAYEFVCLGFTSSIPPGKQNFCLINQHFIYNFQCHSSCPAFSFGLIYICQISLVTS